MCRTLAERITNAMKQREMSQADLARETGLTTSNIAYLVNGKTTDPRLSTLIALSKALNVSLEYLARG